MPTTLTAATDFRGGLSRLRTWLDEHPEIPVAYAHFADETGAELVSSAGLFEAITAAANAADALTHARIEITDPDHRRVTYLTVTGTVADAAPPFEITYESSCYDRARAALLASLGVPAIREIRTWTVTAAHLRDLVTAAGCQ